MVRERVGRRLSTAEAAARLGVKPATLYAYVSRGLLSRERSPDGRTSTFDPAEIDRLARPGRSRRGRRPATDLVVPSALTTIDQGLPWYRGVAVTDLAGTRSFEDVAEWLWTGRFPDPPPEPGPPPWRAGEGGPGAGPPAGGSGTAGWADSPPRPGAPPGRAPGPGGTAARLWGGLSAANPEPG